MLTIDSKTNRKIAHNLTLESMKATRKQQQMILDAINSNREITNELIQKIALK